MNLSTSIPAQTLAYAGCFRGKHGTDIGPFQRPASNVSECAQMCHEPGPDDPYFMMLFPDTMLRQQCGCSSLCALRHTGENFDQVADSQCQASTALVNNALMGAADDTYTYYAAYSIRPEYTTCSKAAMVTPLNRTSQILSYAGMVLNSLILCTFIGFVIAHEAGGSKISGISAVLKFVSPFNLQLTLMAVSLIGVFGCLAEQSRTIAGPKSVYLIPAELVFAEVFKVCFLAYGWGRGATVINSVWPNGTKYFTFLVKSASLLIFSPVIPSVIFAESLRPDMEKLIDRDLFKTLVRSLDLASIAAVFSIDLGLLVCFIVYIRTSTRISATDAIAPRFLKICYYGAAANVICIGAFFTYLFRYVVMDGRYHSPVHDYTLDAIIHLIFTAILVVLLGLKLALHSDAENERREKKSVHDRAKLIATGNGHDTLRSHTTRIESKRTLQYCLTSKVQVACILFPLPMAHSWMKRRTSI
ncbi:hypothetical protein BJ741DRAFT_609794 [Chytriomyces cf. hyalinus JEL632]|nr:hypothetical protein BJ741DRAFT_609794 [Chytriomyces cf. hyalinus JEL632]